MTTTTRRTMTMMSTMEKEVKADDGLMVRRQQRQEKNEVAHNNQSTPTWPRLISVPVFILTGGKKRSINDDNNARAGARKRE